MRPLITLATLAAALVLSACSEKPQTAATRQSDGRPWEGAKSNHVDAGWKVGDKASWEEHLRTRSQQGQNEYTRAPAKP